MFKRIHKWMCRHGLHINILAAHSSQVPSTRRILCIQELYSCKHCFKIVSCTYNFWDGKDFAMHPSVRVVAKDMSAYNRFMRDYDLPKHRVNFVSRKEYLMASVGLVYLVPGWETREDFKEIEHVLLSRGQRIKTVLI